MNDDDFYILYSDKMTIRDYYNLAALTWRVPVAIVKSLILYALLKMEEKCIK